MNIDHFTFIQAEDLEFWAGEEDDDQFNGTSTTRRRPRPRLSYDIGPDADVQGRHTQTKGEDSGFAAPPKDDITEGGKVEVKKHKGLDKVLLRDFSELPEDVDYGDYSVINVSPSVVPAYFPSFRIFNYNVSAEAFEGAMERKERRRRGEAFRRPPPHGHRKPDRGKPREEQCKKDQFKDSWRCHYSKENWHSDPEAPSRKNGLMSPLGYAQYYLPDLGNASETYTPEWELEYMTYGLSAFEKKKKGTDESPEVIPKSNIPKALRNGGGAKYAPYSLEDLTIPSWVWLARKLGDGENRKLRRKFRSYMFMGHGEET